MSIIAVAVAVVLLVWFQRALYRRFWSRKLDMTLSFSSGRAFEGETLTLDEALANSKPLPLPWVTSKFQLSRHIHFLDESAVNKTADTGEHMETGNGNDTPREAQYQTPSVHNQNDLFSIGPYQRITRRHRIYCAKRGFYRIRNMDLVCSDILVLDRQVKRLDCGAELTVYPRLLDFKATDILFRRVYGEIEIKRFTNPDPFAFRGIREYGSGDDFRSINFKATAKTGRLMVNMNNATASQTLMILLNVQPYGVWYDSDVLEEGIRIAASAADRFIAMGLPVGILSNGLDVSAETPVSVLPGGGSGHFYTILTQLARMAVSADCAAFSTTLKELRSQEYVYLLISTYAEDDLTSAFQNMLDAGLSAHWIIPVPPGAAAGVDATAHVTHWPMP
ncbi:MAG: DUF58 domain-containing protein [Oscillospiraceae bacterium]|nr:DUF58 domain-containing protein [Oscillospiraceae bacterium]